MFKNMKSKMGMLLAGMMIVSGAASFAEASQAQMAVRPVLISAPIEETAAEVKYNSNVKFDVKKSGDFFLVVLPAVEGQKGTWTYEIGDEELVQALGANKVSARRAFAFKVQDTGVTTVTFTQNDGPQDIAAKTLDLVVYKNNTGLYVEENQIVSAISSNIFYDGQEIGSGVSMEVIDGITMLPLESVLQAMGYDVTLNEDGTKAEIRKGAQWTSVEVGKNSYFINRMAPWALSSAPVIADGQVYVPVEFLVEIMGKNVQVDDGNLMIQDQAPTIHSGYVTDISYDETGAMTITISDEKKAKGFENSKIIHTSAAYTLFNTEVKIGDHISVASPMIMTMSLPPQTSAYIVY